MLGWFRHKRQEPKPCPANSGLHVSLEMAWTNGESSWQEKVSAVECLAHLLRERQLKFSLQDGWLELSSGHIVQPRIESLYPLEDGGIGSITTIETSHPSGIPEGVFEFQHSTGDKPSAAIAKGFAGWLDIDWPVLQDALRKQPESSTVIEMPFPGKLPDQKRMRRALLGPVSWARANPRPADDTEHDSFCPCCLFTKSVESFKPILGDTDFHAIRFFAMRDADGTASADARINGLDADDVKSALREYVGTWPGEGFELRKQYVIVQNC